MIAETIGKIYAWFFLRMHKEEIRKQLYDSPEEKEFLAKCFVSDLISVRMIADLHNSNESFTKEIKEFAKEDAEMVRFDYRFWMYMASKEFGWIKSEWSKDQFTEYVHSLDPKWLIYADTGVEFFEKQLLY